MSIVAAILTALAIVCAQALHGGLLVPAFVAPSDALLVLAAIPALWSLLRNSSPTGPAGLAGVVIFFGYVIWRCAHAPDQLQGRVELGQCLAAGLVFVIACGGLADTRARFVFLGLLVAAAFAQAVIGVLQFAHGGMAAPLGWMATELQTIYEDRFANRAHGFFLNPNQFAWLTGWAALISLSLATWSRVKILTRVVLVYLTLVFIGVDVLSGSRGGLASLLAGVGVFSVLSMVGIFTVLRRGRVLATSGALILVTLCLGVGAAVYSSNWVAQGRVEIWGLVKLDDWQRTDVRTRLLEHGVRQFQVSPLVGMGPGAFAVAARLYRVDNQPNDALFAHDDWLQLLVEYGFVGLSIALLAGMILFAGGVRRFLRSLRGRALLGDPPQSNSAAILLGVLSASVAFAGHSFTDFNLHVPANALLAAGTLGLMAGIGGGTSEPRRLPAVVVRTAAAIFMVCLAVSLGVYTWHHAPADFQSLQAANALADGRVSESIRHAELGLKHAPEDAALLENLGNALYSYESTLQFADNEVDRKAINSLNLPLDGEGILLPAARQNLYERAAFALASAQSHQPCERRYAIELANALVETGRTDEAERQFLEAIRLDPSHGYAYAAYGDYLYAADHSERALRIYSLGAALPGGTYCNDRAQEIVAELAPPPTNNPPAVVATPSETPEDEK